MTTHVTAIIVDTIKMLSADTAMKLDVHSAQQITLGSLDLDSLATLRLAMELEDALGMDIEVVDFPETLTISELADQLSQSTELRKPVPAST